MVASEDCLEVCFVGLVLGGNYVWYLLIQSNLSIADTCGS